jgi:hypothetical protein
MLKLRQILFVKVRPHNELYFRLIPSNYKCSVLAMRPFVFMKFAIPQVAKISARSTSGQYSHWEFQDCLIALVIIVSHLSVPSILIPVAFADALIYLSSPINLTKTFRSLTQRNLHYYSPPNISQLRMSRILSGYFLYSA